MSIALISLPGAPLTKIAQQTAETRGLQVIDCLPPDSEQYVESAAAKKNALAQLRLETTSTIIILPSDLLDDTEGIKAATDFLTRGNHLFYWVMSWDESLRATGLAAPTPGMYVPIRGAYRALANTRVERYLRAGASAISKENYAEKFAAALAAH